MGPQPYRVPIWGPKGTYRTLLGPIETLKAPYRDPWGPYRGPIGALYKDLIVTQGLYRGHIG